MARRSPSFEIEEVPKGKEAADVESEEEAGDEEEEEYEIEEILDAQRGRFPEGRIGYFVKWKGYGSDENSWVDEVDAGNAGALIEAFWTKKNAKKGNASAKGSKGARQSTAGRSASAKASASTAESKKRGRKSTAKDDSDSDDMAVDREDSPPITKKAKKSAKAAARSVSEATEDPAMELRTMADYMHVKDWESTVKSVDTVERVGKDLFVYFTLETGEAVRERSDLCKARFPQKLLDFYEGNLRWKATEEED